MVEALLLVIDEPTSADTMAAAIGEQSGVVLEILQQIAAEYAARGSGFSLRETAAGWRLYTAAECAPAVERLLLAGTQTRLSKAALETLSVVAYKQPCTRSQVAAIRGVNVDGVMRTLTLRGLIREVGTEETTGAHRYVTTELFLELLGLSSLDELPPLAPLLPDIETIDEPL
nr:SMC-Scp complex subunit ScpB [Corynebacterium choanae]